MAKIKLNTSDFSIVFPMLAGHKVTYTPQKPMTNPCDIHHALFGVSRRAINTTAMMKNETLATKIAAVDAEMVKINAGLLPTGGKTKQSPEQKAAELARKAEISNKIAELEAIPEEKRTKTQLNDLVRLLTKK